MPTELQKKSSSLESIYVLPLRQYNNSKVNDDFNISFKNLSYSKFEGFFKKKEKIILKEISGIFTSRRLTIILGASGSGKTSLLNILSGYITKGVHGTLMFNGKLRNEKNFRQNSCYIMHQNNLQPLLTVKEAMSLAVQLKLNIRVSNEEKLKLINDILKTMNLKECYNTRTDHLSGGQRKRLSIALELVENPSVMFFDEPTSGLDSALCKQCISLLKDLANEGRIVVCSINQPSAALFELFDDLYALSSGQCIYQGSVSYLLHYLNNSGFRCPIYHNPADFRNKFIIEISLDEHKSCTSYLINNCKNGQNFFINNLPKKDRNHLQVTQLYFSKAFNQNQLITKTQHKKYKQVLFEFRILVQRTIKILSRDKSLMHLRLLSHLIIGLFIGTLYYRIGNNGRFVIDNFNYLFFTVMFLMLTAFNSMALTFSKELPVIVREHFNQWYTSKTYFFAIMVADIPIQIFSTLLYTLPTYLMTDQPLEWFRIIQFFTICALVSLVSQSYGILIGICLNPQNAVIFGPLFFLPFTIFSGFFIRIKDAHQLFQWLFHISFIKYSLEGLVLAVYGHNRSALTCDDVYCHYRYIPIFLKEYGMNGAVFSMCVLFLFSIFLIIRFLTYFALRKQIENRA